MTLNIPGKTNKLWEKTWIKRIFYLIILLTVWEFIYKLKIFNPLLLPGPKQVFIKFMSEMLDGSLVIKAGASLYMILLGLLISIAFVLVFTVFAMMNKTLKNLAGTLITVLDPLPGIALLPLAILWFGIGRNAILFIMIHSILWPILLNVMTGFESVPLIYQEVGTVIGISKPRMVLGIFIPAAFPNILAGLKTGWSRAWRALISAEMVFGATGRSSGLGWDIYMKRSFLDMQGMFASLIMIMIIGILVEDLFFKRVEEATIVKWGMVR